MTSAVHAAVLTAAVAWALLVPQPDIVECRLGETDLPGRPGDVRY